MILPRGARVSKERQPGGSLSRSSLEGPTGAWALCKEVEAEEVETDQKAETEVRMATSARLPRG